MNRIAMAIVFALLLAAGDASADFKLAASQDVIILVDGTKITGTIIARGLKAVVIVVKGENDGEAKELVIPKTKVDRIEKGDSDQEISSFTTDGVDGIKVVTGEGFRDSEDAEPAAPAAEGDSGKPAAGGKKGDLRKRIETAMKSNPVVRQMVRNSGGMDNVMTRLETDEKLRRQVEGYLRLRPSGQGGRAVGTNMGGRGDRRAPGAGRRQRDKK